jgi:hypothetical protein
MNSALQDWRSWLPVHPAADLLPMMTDAELRELADDIKESGLKERIKVWWNTQTNEKYLVDGRNRAAALSLIGESLIDGTDWNDEFIEEVRVAKWDDPLAYIISLNIRRRHLTAEQKRDVIAKLLKVAPDKSNRQVAKTVSVDHKTVAKVRGELEATGEIPQLTETVGADGRARPARKAVTAPSPELEGPQAKIEQPVEQVQHSVETAVTVPVTTEPHIADRQFGPLSGGEWLWLGEDCRRATGRGKNRRRFYSDEFMKLAAFHGVPLQDLESVE